MTALSKKNKNLKIKKNKRSHRKKKFIKKNMSGRWRGERRWKRGKEGLEVLSNNINSRSSLETRPIICLLCLGWTHLGVAGFRWSLLLWGKCCNLLPVSPTPSFCQIWITEKESHPKHPTGQCSTVLKSRTPKALWSGAHLVPGVWRNGVLRATLPPRSPVTLALILKLRAHSLGS